MGDSEPAQDAREPDETEVAVVEPWSRFSKSIVRTLDASAITIRGETELAPEKTTVH